MGPKPESRIIAVGGKGGVGKTALAALLTKLISSERRNLLVIDADPAVGLGMSLGIGEYGTLGQLREELIEVPEQKLRLQGERPVKEAVRELLVASARGFDVLVMGRGEGPGCFCSLNELLKYGIKTLTREYDTTLVDCEAGIEQVNRRALSNLDQLILVSDPNVRGLETAARVREIACKHNIKPLRSFLIVNKVKSRQERDQVSREAKRFQMEILGFVPVDQCIEAYNLSGRPLIDLPESCPSFLAMREVFPRIEQG